MTETICITSDYDRPLYLKEKAKISSPLFSIKKQKKLNEGIRVCFCVYIYHRSSALAYAGYGRWASASVKCH